jgi:hypothetical protein
MFIKKDWIFEKHWGEIQKEPVNLSFLNKKIGGS